MPVGKGIVDNAVVMYPAGRRRVPRSGRLVTAQAAAGQVGPDRVPSAAVAAVENDWAATGIGEGTLTVVGEAGKGGAAVGGDRCPGTVGVGASRVVVSDDDLVGVIRVSRRECRRLGNIWETLSAGDQVHVRAAIYQRCRYVLHKLCEGSVPGRFTSL